MPDHDFVGGEASDNCGGTPTVDWLGDVVSPDPPPCANNYTITRTYKATDECGNTATCTQVITVHDTTPPEIHCPEDASVECATDVPDADFTGGTASDNCGGAPTVTHLGDEVSSFVCTNHYTLTRTYQAEDACGNTATCTQVITVHDITPPEIHCPESASVECSSDVPDTDFAGGTASDNCGGTPSVDWLGDVVSPDPPSCPNDYTITRTYRAMDECGNTATCTQVITVHDNTPPEIGCPPNLSLRCANEVPDPATDYDEFVDQSGYASDNCDEIPAISHVSDLISGQTCVNRFTLTRTYRATDACGNSATCTQVITVNDTTPPDIECEPDFTVQCSSEAFSGFGTSPPTDNCGGTPTIEGLDYIEYSGDTHRILFISRTFTATDECGNASTCTQTATVHDTTPPEIHDCPSDIDSNVNAPNCTAVVTWTAPTTTDNCGDATITQTSGPPSGSTFANGSTTTIVYTATDNSGLTNTCSFTVTVTASPDMNDDGFVDLLDVPIFSDVLLGLDTTPYRVARADVNCDGNVDGLDIQPFLDVLIP